MLTPFLARNGTRAFALAGVLLNHQFHGAGLLIYSETKPRSLLLHSLFVRDDGFCLFGFVAFWLSRARLAFGEIPLASPKGIGIYGYGYGYGSG